MTVTDWALVAMCAIWFVTMVILAFTRDDRDRWRKKAEWLAEEWAASDRKEFNTGATAQQLLVAADLSTRGDV